MRFIPSPCLKAGMVLSEDLYGFSNNLLLSKNHILTECEIKRIQELNYKGAYIQDSINIEAARNNIIKNNLKINAVHTIKRAFLQVDKTEDNKELLINMRGIVCDIVDEIIHNKDATINMNDLKNFDDYTYEHSVNVCVYSILLGLEAGLSKPKLYELGLGAILHDIGKMFVSKEILGKPGKLDTNEFNEIKRHCKLGSDYLKEKWDFDPEARMAVLTHHERQDGHGYPFGLPADKQTLYGKIVAISDVYDALISDRPYRKAISPSEAMEHIMGSMDVLFDPKIVELFMRKIIPYPTGSLVRLSNGFTGVIVENHKKCGMRPTVKIIPDKTDENYEQDCLQKIIIYDLYNDNSLLNITIKGLITNNDLSKTAK